MSERSTHGDLQQQIINHSTVAIRSNFFSKALDQGIASFQVIINLFLLLKGFRNRNFRRFDRHYRRENAEFSGWSLQRSHENRSEASFSDQPPSLPLNAIVTAATTRRRTRRGDWLIFPLHLKRNRYGNLAKRFIEFIGYVDRVYIAYILGAAKYTVLYF